LSKQSSIAKHRIQQQPFVTIRRRFSERLRIAEVHVDWTDRHARARNLRAKLQRNPLIRLDAHREDIRLDAFAAFAFSVFEEQQRRLLELNRNLSNALS